MMRSEETPTEANQALTVLTDSSLKIDQYDVPRVSSDVVLYLGAKA